jgi:hypothetical protein
MHNCICEIFVHRLRLAYMVYSFVCFDILYYSLRPKLAVSTLSRYICSVYIHAYLEKVKTTNLGQREYF